MAFSLTAKAFDRDPTNLNMINVALMLLSCGVAYLVPLELFLFSYAALGPLHYLTQISWLQKRGFFTRGRYDYLFLLALCLGLLTLSIFRGNLGFMLALGFGSAIALAFPLKSKTKVVLILGVMVTAVLTRNFPAYRLFFGIFLPTLIHVYVFTGLFILYGALKSRSRSGYLSFCVFIACGLIFFILSPSLLGVSENAYLRASYEPFQRMAFYFAQLLNVSDVNTLADIYASASGTAILRLIAFAYTYHYLNWFSKTSIIGWHEISRVRMVGIIVLWILAVGIYFVDYRVGFAVLLTLSLGHVILEFPLNHQTIWGIARELSRRLRKRPPLAQQTALTP